MTVDLLDSVRDHCERGDFESALSLCDEAIRQRDVADQPAVYGIRAYVYGYMKRYDAAVDAANAGLERFPENVSLLLGRAADYLELRRFREACADLERVLTLELELATPIMTESALLLQAICFAELGQLEDVLRSCSRLPSGSRVWALGKLQTKDQLEAVALATLGRPAQPSAIPPRDESPISTPPLSAAETAAMATLTNTEWETIDAAIVACVRPRWRKVAMVVGSALAKLRGTHPALSDSFYVERIRQLDALGKLESKGDLSHMRFSEVRLRVTGHPSGAGASR